MSQRSTLWAVSGAIGLTSFGLGAFALQGTGPAPIEARPAVVVPLRTASSDPSSTPSATGPESASASPSSTDQTPSAKPSPKSGVSPVSPPSAETPD